jgi:O-antigen/teichoic acid export membrane protein
MLMPQVSRAFADEGEGGLRRVVWKASCVLAIFMTPYCMLLAVFGGSLLCLLFGDEYAGHHATIMVVALRELVATFGLASADGLSVAGRPQVILIAELVGFVVTIATAMALMGPLEVLGAAAGYLAGAVATTSIVTSGYYVIVVRKTRWQRTNVGDFRPTDTRLDLT